MMEFFKFSSYQLQQLMGARYWAMYTPSVYVGCQHIQISLGADESLWKHAGYHCRSCTQIFFTLFWVSSVSSLGPLHAWNQMLGPGQQCRAQERAPRPEGHRQCPFKAQVRVTRNNVKSNLKHGNYVLLGIIMYHRPSPKTHHQPMAGNENTSSAHADDAHAYDVCLPTSCTRSIIRRNT